MSVPSLAQAARTIFTSSLARCRVDEALARQLHTLAPTLAAEPRVLVVAIGKAAATMLAALLAQPQLAAIPITGILVAPAPLTPMPPGVRFFPGQHPLPGESSFAAARAILELLDNAPPATLCLFLISGGASAMVELPLDPRIILADTRTLYAELVHSGASISEINCVRKHFSAVKGGRLAMRARHLRTLTLLLSDVPAGQQDALGSGPTLPDPTTVADCLHLLDHYDLWPRLSAPVRRYFHSPTLPETPKPGDLDPRAALLLSSADLATHAAAAAQDLGYEVTHDDACDNRDFREVADHLLAKARALRRPGHRICLISVGECLVQVRPAPHAPAPAPGGRNQHLALYAALRMTPHDNGIAFLSAGSDGIDGNSPAAGAVVTSETHTTTPAFAREAERALRDFASHPLLHRQGCTIATGPTGLNLRDLRVLLAED